MIFYFYFEFFLWTTFFLMAFREFKHSSQLSQEALMQRWTQNFSTEVLNRLISFFIVTAVVQLFGLQNGFHVSNSSVDFRKIVLSLFLLDFLFYWRHRFYHWQLWRVHAFHHEDSSFDLSLSLRVHPIEVVLHLFLVSLFYLLAPLSSFETRIVVEVFAIQALLSHLDWELPHQKCFRILRRIFVFPQDHKVHHSPYHHNRNFGFLFSFWDSLFGTAEFRTTRIEVLGLNSPPRKLFDSLFCIRK